MKSDGPRSVVVAPDSFKGSCPASRVAVAIATGWRSTRPQDQVITLPLADGGEGTIDAVHSAVSGSRRIEVDGLLTETGRTVEWLLLPDGTGVVELAGVCGIQEITSPDPMRSHTRLLGAVIADALDSGASGLRIALGGSASSDGGSGVLAALGARFLDAGGKDVDEGPAGLLDLASVDLSGMRPPPPGGVTMLVDVDNPLLGPSGAAATFGPQKGATPADVAHIERALARLADLLPAVDPHAPGAGSAGGTAFGLSAWGAVASSGAGSICDISGLDAAVRSADLVITGEGCFDSQSNRGKLVSVVADRARTLGTPVALVAGSVMAATPGFVQRVELARLAGSSRASIDEPELWLEEAGRVLAGFPAG